MNNTTGYWLFDRNDTTAIRDEGINTQSLGGTMFMYQINGSLAGFSHRAVYRWVPYYRS